MKTFKNDLAIKLIIIFWLPKKKKTVGIHQWMKNSVAVTATETSKIPAWATISLLVFPELLCE